MSLVTIILTVVPFPSVIPISSLSSLVGVYAFSISLRLGLLAFLSVMTYAELGSALPKAGAGYSYVQESSGGFPGFVTGWISWFGQAVAGSLYAITFAKYTLHFLSGFGFIDYLGIELQILERIVVVTLAIFFIFINYFDSY